MSILQSDNFAFLSRAAAPAWTLASCAEQRVFDDPHSSLLKLRLFGEMLAQRVAAANGVSAGERHSQFELLRLLTEAGLLPVEIRQDFHDLRTHGNAAAHRLAGDTALALRLLASAHRIGGWYVHAYAPGNALPAPFRAPSHPAEAVANATAALEAEVRRQAAREVERLVTAERRKHREELERIRTHALRRGASRTPPPAVPSVPGDTTTWTSPAPPPSRAPSRFLSAPEARPRRAWRHAARWPGWESYHATAGGRLRAADPLGDVTSAGLRGAVSQVAVFTRGPAAAAPTAAARHVATVLRRLVGRGERPPVDPLVEKAILERAGLVAHLRAPQHPGALVGTLGPTVLPTHACLAAAAVHRAPFVLDPDAQWSDGAPLFSVTDRRLLNAIQAAFGATAGQWVTPRVGPTALLTGDATAADAPTCGLLVAHAEGRPTIVVSEDVAPRPDDAASDTEVDVLRWSDAPGGASPDVLERRLADALPREPAAESDAVATALVWGPAVAHRVLLAVAEGVERGWLHGARWTIELHEPLDVAAPAMHVAVELVAALAEVWGEPTLAPACLALRHVHAGAVACTELRAVGEGRYELAALPTSTDDAAPADLRIRIECFHGPYHRLPLPAPVPEVVVRSASLPLDLMEVRAPGAARVRIADPAAPAGWALRRLLQGIFGKRDFQPDGPAPRGQEAAIRRLLAGRDTVVLLPTGAGKSLIYQFATLLLPGIALVVDPLVALIEDQIDGLRANGIDRAIGITGADRASGAIEEKLARVRTGDAWFVHVAPERLQIAGFRQALRALARRTPLALVVVDEAHCVSEWGHDFRPAYLDLGRVLRQVGEDAAGEPPPLVALTGTASRAVLKDLLAELGIDRRDGGSVVSPASFDRPELRFSVVRAPGASGMATLTQVVRDVGECFDDPATRRSGSAARALCGVDTLSGIVFCQTVNGRGGVQDVADVLARALDVSVPIYAGSAPTGFTGDFEQAKRAGAEAFKANEVPFLVATKAYGMGIDKPNVRWIVHLGVPGSIEAYYQEAGRAGRDRREAQCVLVHTPRDADVHEYFSKQTYAGVAQDLACVREVLTRLRPVGEPRATQVPMMGAGKNVEYALHRLRLLGVVTDYEVDWSRRCYHVQLGRVTPESLDEALVAYVRRAQPGRVPALRRTIAADAERRPAHRAYGHARWILRFVYDTVVAARRRALDEMLQLAGRATSDADVRQAILRYLAPEGAAERIQPLVDREPFTFGDWLPLFDELRSADEGEEWRGATARLLESSPDHPGLLLGRAVAELLAPGSELSRYRTDAEQALHAASSRYLVDTDGIAAAVAWLVEWVADRSVEALGVTFDLAERTLGSAVAPALDHIERRLLADTTVTDVAVLDRLLRRRRLRHTRHLLATTAGFTERTL